MQPLKELQGTVTELPRGGYLVDTKVGYVQFGSPPETIKDTMQLPEGVPLIFVLPKNLFNADKGISLGELEFPIYWNFFIRKKKTTVIGTRDQGRRLLRVLREAVFGPTYVDASQDVHPTSSDTVVPNLKEEMKFYRNFNFKDLLAFRFFSDSRITIGGVTIEMDEKGDYDVWQDSKKLIHIPGTIEYVARYLIGERLREPYVPPLFGVSCLGPSHGFDPEENTSGYIVWINHRGIMVDPPVNSTEWLTDSNVNSKFIDSIILTHCHADHDAGTFQKIMEESRITIYSTRTVIGSFLRKYAALSQESTDYLSQLFNFHPIYLGKPFYIHGAEFKAFYTLHSIPAIGFTINFQGQTFVYSSDHKAEPEIHQQLLDKGVITRERYDQLQSFPWDSDVIYHESGVPPLHTSIDWLNSLPPEIQKKTVIYHIAKKDFPEKTHLTLAKFGIENTLYFKVKPSQYEKTYEILGLLRHLDFSQEFPLEKIQEFLMSIEEENFRKGETIIRRGSYGEKFYIIYTGNVAVFLDGLEQKKIYGAFEYFGEASLVSNKPTAADVVAETDVKVFTMERDKFLSFISGTEFEETLRSLAQTRSRETWNILSTSRFFKRLTSYQKTWLESVFKRVEVVNGKTLAQEGQLFDRMYVVRKGEVEVIKEGSVIEVLKQGDFIGNLHEITRTPTSEYTYRTKGKVALFAVNTSDMVSFAEKNPGLIMKIKSEI
jgi:CRP-like cAMP-binding protein/phosphoribosyl 1,2-cyclic phosphodiesterase